MKITSDTDIRVTTDWGGVVMFYAGVTKEVADEIGILALQQGAKQEGSDTVVEAVEVAIEDEVEITEESSTESLLDKAIKACAAMIDEGNPEDFNMDGSPKAKIVNEKVGDKVSAEIREQAWTAALNG